MPDINIQPFFGCYAARPTIRPLVSDCNWDARSRFASVRLMESRVGTFACRGAAVLAEPHGTVRWSHSLLPSSVSHCLPPALHSRSAASHGRPFRGEEHLLTLGCGMTRRSVRPSSRTVNANIADRGKRDRRFGGKGFSPHQTAMILTGPIPVPSDRDAPVY